MELAFTEKFIEIKQTLILNVHESYFGALCVKKCLNERFPLHCRTFLTSSEQVEETTNPAMPQ